MNRTESTIHEGPNRKYCSWAEPKVLFIRTEPDHERDPNRTLLRRKVRTEPHMEGRSEPKLLFTTVHNSSFGSSHPSDRTLPSRRIAASDRTRLPLLAFASDCIASDRAVASRFRLPASAYRVRAEPTFAPSLPDSASASEPSPADRASAGIRRNSLGSSDFAYFYPFLHFKPIFDYFNMGFSPKTLFLIIRPLN